MAVVLYSGPDAQRGQATASVGNDYSNYSADGSAEVENIAHALDSLRSKDRKKKYIGLANQGATCYMNSTLQSLYMTPEFRKFILSWRYNPEIHQSKDDCIPYHLQKLFANLQMSRKNYVDTRELTKSFGWQSAMSFEQHDIQEFLRVLFDAIEQSYELVGDSCSTINELYQGTLVSYVKCEECGYESNRNDNFLDLSLPIKNEFGTGVLNSSLQMALENYLKPEKLEGDNQYECSQCNKKVNAIKGLKLSKCPKILSISLNRFTLDWETLQRVKITDKVSFPLTLNMNDYMQGYEGIQNKLYEKEVRRMEQYCHKQTEKNKESEDQRRKDLTEKKHAKVEGLRFEEQSTASQPVTEEVIHTVPKKTEKGVKIAVEAQVQAEENAQMTDEIDEDNPYLFNQKGPRRKVDYSNPDCEDDDEDQVMYDSQDQGGAKANFEGDSYKISHKTEKFAILPQDQRRILSLTEEGREMADALEKIRDMEEKEQQTTTNAQTILEYLKAGDFLYELYSVLVHSGSAMGGHYYAYIKSLDDGKWYNFNDANVTTLSLEEIQKVYGGSNGGNATAYMLMYRQYDPVTKDSPILISDDVIPDYLKSEIDQETDQMVKEQLEIEERVLSLKLKVYINDDFKIFNMKKTDTLQELALRAIQDFGLIDMELKNFRFRGYDPKLKAKLAIYDKFDTTLMKLQVYNYFILVIETKTENEQFEGYDPDCLYLSVVKHVQEVQYNFNNVESLQTSVITINKSKDSVADLDNKLGDMFGIPPEKLIVLIRHGDRTELFNIEWRKPKKIGEASRLDHGAILYVEEGDPNQQLNNYKWHQEFMNELERITLNINDPETDPNADIFALKLQMNKQNTLLELKQAVSEKLGISIGEFVLKRNMVQRELKNMSLTLSELGLFNGCLIRVEKGKPHEEGVFELAVYSVKLSEEAEHDNTLFEKTELCRHVIKPNISALELKQQLIEMYNKEHPEKRVSLENVRLRNPKVDDIGEVINDSETMENCYLYDEKQIYLQIVDPSKTFELVSPLHTNSCLHVLLREWNPDTWMLGPLYEIKVDKQIYASKFSQFLSEKVFPHIPSEDMLFCRVNLSKSFKRGDLVLKRWNKLRYQMTWIGQSTLEVNRDSVYVVVKDQRIQMREELTDEEVKKYGSTAYLDHLYKKQSRNIGLQHRDLTFLTAQNAKPDYSKNKRPETGIKINVGKTSTAQKAEMDNQRTGNQMSTKNASSESDKKDESKDKEETEEACYIEPLF